MARSNPRWAGGARRTGVVRGSILNRRARSGGRFDWLALTFVTGLAVIVLLAVSSMLNQDTTPTVSPRASAVAVADGRESPRATAESSLLPFSPEASASARPTPSPSPTPSPTPTRSPSPTPSPPRTASPTPTPTRAPTVPPSTAQPTAPATGLVILDPVDGSTTDERVIVVRGLAPPGAVVTRDVPLWFDEHVVADSAGRWSFVLQLNNGQNNFIFRIGDDRTTEMLLTVNYSPG